MKKIAVRLDRGRIEKPKLASCDENLAKVKVAKRMD